MKIKSCLNKGEIPFASEKRPGPNTRVRVGGLFCL